MLSTLHTPYLINVTSNGTHHPLEFIPPNETRTLVGAAVNPANETKQIISLFQDKVAALTTTLNSLHMSPCDILLGYKVYWWPAIKYMAPALNLSQHSNILRLTSQPPSLHQSQKKLPDGFNTNLYGFWRLRI